MKGWLSSVLRGSGHGPGPAPTVLQGFWHGPPLGPLRQACLNSFVRMGHTFELYVYEPVRVPDGVLLKQAEDVIPFGEVFYYRNPRTGLPDLGPFSDLFRFKLLSERGGWWSDVDTVCLSPDIPTVERAWAQELPELNPAAVGTSQLAMRKGDPLALELYARCLEISRGPFPHRESLGPHLISTTIRDLQLPPNVFGSPRTFYPIRWIEMFKLWLPQFSDEVIERSRAALFMPIFQSFPQYLGLTMAKMPPPGSFLAEVCRTYIPHLEGVEHYRPEEIVEGTRRFFDTNADWAVNELSVVCGGATLDQLGLT
jgi:hypothetical protein